ncbi:A/G-specific adenine glycosylase [Tabrizicola oligotrophica]|uniref:Adenine DNA glycosylase n=1 Tax=Tabrizicola oligotrophica TaxID=2710650 RepID=A0A6M0QRL4_9RHOB|nr:A/G-specific adenine glycosylase [Tabrizicola oligotrophica]NEY90169.1 A/G-specific adenine glycosylase [Tabrizicola oligotrophica]
MREIDCEVAGARLLRWYDAHARAMPWRVGPADRAVGVRPDPYHVWLSEVMLQQTTVAAVRDYFRRFLARWPRVEDLAAAEDAAVMGEWAGLGYYARARNLLACARAVVRDHGGQFPKTVEGLRALPGVGPYTAAAVASIAFDAPAVVVDGNVERVCARLFAVQTPLPAAKPELVRLAGLLTPDLRPGDHAQAMMDLGATICTPRNPTCGICPLLGLCAGQAAGAAAELPRKLAKPVKPVRQGVVWVLQRPDGAVLVERRPERGLLGGMLGFPGDAWDGGGGPAPVSANWTDAGEVRHTFTHFHLQLRVMVATGAGNPERGGFMADFRPDDLPTVMRKAWDAATLRAVE